MADDLNVVLKAHLDYDGTKDAIENQIEELQKELKKLNIKVDLGEFTGFASSLTEITKAAKVAKNAVSDISKAKVDIDIKDAATQINNLSDKFTVSIEKLKSTLEDVAINVNDISNISVGTDINGNIDSAIVTYEKLGKTVKTTMQLVDGEWLSKFDLKDNIKQTEKFSDSVEKTENRLKNFIKSIDLKSDKDLFNLTGKLDEQSLLSLQSGINKLKVEISDLSKIKIIDESSLNNVKNKMAEIGKQYSYIIQSANLDKKINEYIIKQKKDESKQYEYIEKKQREIALLEKNISNTSDLKGLDANNYSDDILKLKRQLLTLGQDDTLSLDEQKKSMERLLIDTKDLVSSNTKDLDILNQKKAIIKEISDKLKSLPEQFQVTDTTQDISSALNVSETVANLKILKDYTDEYYKTSIASDKEYQELRKQKELDLQKIKKENISDTTNLYNQEESKLNFIYQKKEQLLELERQINFAANTKGLNKDNYPEISDLKSKLDGYRTIGVDLYSDEKQDLNGIIDLVSQRLKLEKDDLAIQKLKEDSLDYIRQKQNQILDLERQINNAHITKGVNEDNYSPIINELNSKLGGYETDGVTLYSKEKREIEDIINLLTQKFKKEKDDLATLKQQENLYSKINEKVAVLNSISNKNDGYDKDKLAELIGQFRYIESAVKNQSMAIEQGELAFNKLIPSIKDFESASKKASAATNTLTSRFKRFLTYYSFYDVFQLGKRAVREMVDVIFDLDDALVELRKVSDLSGDSLTSFTKQAYELGIEISKSGSDVIRASTAFAKAGYNDDQLLGLAETALKLTSIGDGLTDTTESAETLISVLRGFSKDTSEVTNIMDAINNVSNNAAVKFSDITMALQRMSGVMSASNITMEESIGMFTAINEVLRNTEMSSTALNSISMRIRGLSESGESIDGLAPKLQRMFKSVAGISITDQAGQVKSLYEIIGDLAPKWDKLTENQKNYISQEAAGLRQSKAFLVMMDNYDRVLEATSLAYNSAGSSAREFEKWQDSLEGRMNGLRSAIEQFSSKTINSEFVKSIIATTTAIVNLGTACGGAIPVVIALSSAFAAFKFLTFAQGIGSLTLALSKLLLPLAALFPQLAIAAGVGVGILAISKGINYLTSSAERANKEVSTLSNELKDLQSKSGNVRSLSEEYITLRGIDNKTTEQWEEFYDIQNQLRELMPEINGYHDEQGNFIISEKENLQSLIGTYEEYIAEKRKERAEATKESSKLTTNEFDKEKERLEDLIRYENLRKRYKSNGLSAEDEKEYKSLHNKLDAPLINVQEEINKTENSIKNLSKVMSSEILNMAQGTKEWSKLTEDESNQINKALAEIDDPIKLFNLEIGLRKGYISGSDFINMMQNMPSAIDDAKNSTNAYNEEIKTLTDTLTDLANHEKIIESVNKELKAGNELSISSINDLIDAYPELESVMSEYLAGTASISDVMKEVNDAYSEDTDNYKNAILDKLSLNEDFYSNSVNVGGKLVNTFSENYNIDLANCRNLAEAKIKIENETMNQIAGIWAKYYDVESGSFTEEYNKLLREDTETGASRSVANKILQAKAEKDARIAKLYEISSERIIIPKSGDVSSSSKKEKDAWLEEFEKEYNKIKYLRDMDIISNQQYYDKLNSLNKKYFVGRSKYIAEERKYNLELYNLDKEFAEKRISDMQFSIDKTSEFELGNEANYKMVVMYERMQDEIHALAEKARKRGLSNNSEYIQGLQKQWVDYSNKITALKMDSFDIANSKIDDKIVQAELRQQLAGEGTEEYQQIELEKYNFILERETLLQTKIAQLQAIGTAEAKKQAEELIDTYYDTVAERYSIIKNMQDMEIESLQKQKDAIQDIRDFTVEMIKEQYQAEIDKINEVFNAKKKLLQDEKDSYSYNKGLTEKTDLVADLENQLAIIKNDETAIKRRKELEEELAQARQDLTEYQYEHSIDTQMDALDEQQELSTSKIEETLDNEVALRKEADELIRRSGEELYDILIDYSQEYGRITEEEINTAWENATTGINGFTSAQDDLLESLKLVTAELSKIQNLSITDYANYSGLSTMTFSEAKSTMRSNSTKWLTADETERQRLHDENVKIGESMGWTYDPATGKWYYYDASGKKVPVYHSGGIVGGVGTKPTEELAKLLKGELVITPPQAKMIMDRVTNNNNSQVVSPTVIFNIEGEASQSTIDLIKQNAKEVANIVAAEFNKVKSNTGWKKPVGSY